MKQTAVEWLRDLYENQPAYDESILDEQWEKALEMEKEQMRLADKNGQDRNQYKHDCQYGGVEYWDSVPKPFEEYYNETFNINDRHN
jgi:hypothetical protein